MSGHHFHVHGPHDHAVEHGGHGGDRFAAGIAVMTAILATLGALFGYEGGATQNAAMLHKNDAAIKKTEAANQWNYYQAKSNKQNLAELAAAIVTSADKQRYLDEVERYKAEKADIKASAEKLEAESRAADEKSEHSLHEHHRWAQAMTLMQVAISLAAITLLTRRKWLFWTSIGTAAGGVAVAALALAHL
ncbi:MAG: DUF4337 domain-containing protein [Rhodocyclaceae bacterium]|nr:DUF4337 domain-containing protein [Rhodocyclaceae bacterium]